MKGYSEQRGVQSQVIFDAATGRFAPCDVVHDFAVLMAAKPEHPPDAVVIVLPHRKVVSNATTPLRKRRDAVMQVLKMQRAG
jgi:hypothetical protein